MVLFNRKREMSIDIEFLNILINIKSITFLISYFFVCVSIKNQLGILDENTPIFCNNKTLNDDTLFLIGMSFDIYLNLIGKM